MSRIPFTMTPRDNKPADQSSKVVTLFTPDSDCESALIIDCHEHVRECHRLRQQLGKEEQPGKTRDGLHLPSIITRLEHPGDYQEVILTGMGGSLDYFYDFVQMARSIREQGGRVHVLSDGLDNYHCGQDITPDLEGNVDAITVAMIAQDRQTYQRYFHGDVENAFDQMLNFACGASEFVAETSLMVIDGLPGVDIDACRKLAASISVPLKTKSIYSLLLGHHH